MWLIFFFFSFLTDDVVNVDMHFVTIPKIDKSSGEHQLPIIALHHYEFYNDQCDSVPNVTLTLLLPHWVSNCIFSHVVPRPPPSGQTIQTKVFPKFNP